MMAENYRYQIKTSDRVNWECGRDGKFPPVVCQRTGDIYSAFYHVARERITGPFIMLNVSAGTMLPAS
jgi:hypothetical protein